MANSTILYVCTEDGLAIINKPGTLPEWLPPRMVLHGQHITGAWAEPGPPIRVLVVADGALLLSETGGRNWEPVGPYDRAGVRAVSIHAEEEPLVLEVDTDSGERWTSGDAGLSWQVAAKPETPSSDPMQDYRSKLPIGTITSAAIPGAVGMPPALVAGTPEGLEVSPDGGATWLQPALPHEGAITVLARDPERRDRIYAATSTGFLCESGNRGHQWQPINAQSVGQITTIFVLRI